MYDFETAIRAIHRAAIQVCDSEEGGAAALRSAISTHCHAVKDYDKLHVSFDIERRKLLDQCEGWRTAETSDEKLECAKKIRSITTQFGAFIKGLG